MTKYAEMDRYNERYDTITLKQESFRAILQAIEDDNLTQIAKEIGVLIPKQFLLFWFKKANLQTYFVYLSLVCRYNGFGEYEVDVDDGDNTHEKSYTITLIHRMGRKWSSFLKGWLEQGLKTTTGIIPKIDVSENTVVARFHAPI